MKVLALLVLVLGSAAARGSGPYLPSGWRPDGPAFYLPTKQSSTDNPLKDLILHGSEAASSDSLREYGPPKVAQEETQQRLLNENIDVTFTSAEKLNEESLNGSEASATDALREYGPPKLQASQNLISINLPQEVIEKVFAEKSNDDTETVTVKAQEESVTEAEVVEVTTVLAEVPLLIIQAYPESVVVENEEAAVTENALPVELTTISDVQTIIDNTIKRKDTLTEPTFDNLAAVKVELEETVQQIVQNFEQTIEKVSENIIENVEKIEENDFEKVEEKQQIEQHIQNSEENLQVKENIKQADQSINETEQNTLVVEEVVQNIPEDLTYVNNDITPQVEKTESQNEESSYPQFSGSLEEAPEGFLEYGPPGFKEYGPPKEDDLAKATAEDITSESFESTNETRRRRFSPKFKPNKKN